MTFSIQNTDADPILIESSIADSQATGVSIDSLAPLSESRSKPARWTKLSSITIDNFKAIDSLELSLTDVTVLVGPNGSGKSSVLQAIHWAARAASYIAPKNTKEVVSFERLDYLPSSTPLKTAHNSSLSSDTKTRATKVSFKHEVADGDTPMAANIQIWAARNGGAISVHIDGGGAVTPFKQRQDFITAYIPGLAGLSEKETMLVQPLLRRQASSGDAGGVLRNVLFNLASRQHGEADDEKAKHRLTRLNELVQSIHPNLRFSVGFDDREDVNIRATFCDLRTTEVFHVLEAAATGVLQVIQIFAYLILFRPKLLLVDEPDAHLHPDKQERLIEALEKAAVEFKTQIILTTHSPHIARAASQNTKLVWISDGKEKKANDDTIRKLLGWGGLDKKCIFFIEDEDDKPIRTLLRQWPDLHRQITVCRCFGIDNLPRNDLLKGLMLEGDLVVKVLIHRDRDFMTNEECQLWKDKYNASNTFTWCTSHVDVEAYFCQPDYLSSLYSVSITEAENWVNQAAKTISKAKSTYFEKRKLINSSLYKDGGSPLSEQLWSAAGEITPQTVLGKKLHAALKPIIKTAGKDDGLLNNFSIPLNTTLAGELRTVLEQLLT
jgi:ABC-type lipoprotein export system ATPase subunit